MLDSSAVEQRRRSMSTHIGGKNANAETRESVEFWEREKAKAEQDLSRVDDEVEQIEESSASHGRQEEDYLTEHLKSAKSMFVEDMYAIGKSPEEIYSIADEYDELVKEAGGHGAHDEPEEFQDDEEDEDEDEGSDDG